MKLVKAKLKSKEDLELVFRAQCCPDYLKHIKSDPDYQEITVDLDNWAEDIIRCAYCNKSFGKVIGVTDVYKGWLVPLDLFDLDEGPLTVN